LPNIKSASKRVKTNERNRQRNVAVRSAVKTSIKKVFEAIKNDEDQDKLKAAVNRAYSIIDKAVTKGVMHKNTAARKKSRLTRHVNKGTTPA